MLGLRSNNRLLIGCYHVGCELNERNPSTLSAEALRASAVDTASRGNLVVVNRPVLILVPANEALE